MFLHSQLHIQLVIITSRQSFLKLQKREKMFAYSSEKYSNYSKLIKPKGMFLRGTTVDLLK